MKKQNLCLPADLKHISPAYLTINFKDAIRIVVYFLALVAAFVVMFGYFVMASTVPEPSPATDKLIYEKGEPAYGTDTNTFASRI